MTLIFSKKHAAPSTDEEFAILRLIRSDRVGPVTFHKLLQKYGTAQSAISELPQIAQEAGVKNYQLCPEHIIEKELKRAKAIGATALYFGAANYPNLLAHTPDAPPVLWALGDHTLAQRSCVAMVGARDASSLALRYARKLARDLNAAGGISISGLARGIDTAVHQATSGKDTIAVLPSGLDVPYPPDNTELAQRIAQNGLLLTEQPFGAAALKHNFLARNRIIAGCAAMLIVLEAGHRSGALNAAQTAAEYGREVYAVPGHPLDARCAGSNKLLKDGAGIICTAADMIDAIALPPKPKSVMPQKNHAAPINKSQSKADPDIATLILDILAGAPSHEDVICAKLGCDISHVSAAFFRLELDGKIYRDQTGVMQIQRP